MRKQKGEDKRESREGEVRDTWKIGGFSTMEANRKQKREGPERQRPKTAELEKECVHTLLVCVRADVCARVSLSVAEEESQYRISRILPPLDSPSLPPQAGNLSHFYYHYEHDITGVSVGLHRYKTASENECRHKLLYLSGTDKPLTSDRTAPRNISTAFICFSFYI